MLHSYSSCLALVLGIELQDGAISDIPMCVQTCFAMCSRSPTRQRLSFDRPSHIDSHLMPMESKESRVSERRRCELHARIQHGVADMTICMAWLCMHLYGSLMVVRERDGANGTSSSTFSLASLRPDLTINSFNAAVLDLAQTQTKTTTASSSS